MVGEKRPFVIHQAREIDAPRQRISPSPKRQAAVNRSVDGGSIKTPIATDWKTKLPVSSEKKPAIFLKLKIGQV
jgi:hypothetical protein